MPTLEEKIKAQEEKLKQLKMLAQKKAMQERAAASKKQRADETRKKILVGALILEKMEKDQGMKASVISSLGTYLTRADDRALFSLPPLPQNTENKQATQPATAEG